MKPSVWLDVDPGDEITVTVTPPEDLPWRVRVDICGVQFMVAPEAWEEFRAAIARGFGLVRMDPVMARTIEDIRRRYEQGPQSATAPVAAGPLA